MLSLHIRYQMDYTQQIRKFVTSQYLSAGVRITAAVIIPSLLLHHYGILASYIGIPLGALFISLIDNPGPLKHRINGMLTSVLVNFFVITITGLLKYQSILVAFEITLFTILFSLIGVFGNRSNAIGSIAIVVMVLNIDRSIPNENIVEQALHFSIGGIWYALLSILLNKLRPYLPVQQLLGEYLIETGSYLQAKSLFYDKDANSTAIYQQLMQRQINIHHHQSELQEIIFKTRQFVQESTNKGRILMMIYLDSVDLLERIMTSQQDYTILHKEFDESNILVQFKNNIVSLSNALHNIGLAIQGGYAYHNETDLDATFKNSMDQFVELRKHNLSALNIEGFIKLRHILYSLQDITERVKRLEAYSTFDKKLNRPVEVNDVPDKSIQHQQIDFRLLLANFTLKSGHFRHAIRLTVALLIGYIISLLFPVGHGYWILLTIATIIKPAYSITRRRNVHRLLGTLIGAAIGFSTLYIAKDDTVLFIIMTLAMMISFSFLKLQYMISTVFITVYVLLSFHFLSPISSESILTDRIVDTIIGSFIAYIIASFVLPAWEHEQIDNLIAEALQSNLIYFSEVAHVFTGKLIDLNKLRITRKEAFVALANLSDNFQRMLSEPKSHQPNLKQYHQFVSASHMLTSHIASLSYYAQQYQNQYVDDSFVPMINYIEKQLNQAMKTTTENTMVEPIVSTSKFPINKKVLQLLDQRKKELEEKIESGMTAARKKLSDLKTITDQFQLIYATVVDQIKVLQQIKQK